jgi:hypothetical protein
LYIIKILNDAERRRPHFPYDYGDSISLLENEPRFSNNIADILADDRVQCVIISAMLNHGVPIVVGTLDVPNGYVSNDVPRIDPTEVARRTADHIQGNGFDQRPINDLPIAIAMLQPPINAVGKKVNTGMVVGSIFILCANGFGGAHIEAAACLGTSLSMAKACIIKVGNIFSLWS